MRVPIGASAPIPSDRLLFFGTFYCLDYLSFDVHAGVFRGDVTCAPPLLRERRPCRPNTWTLCVSTCRLPDPCGSKPIVYGCIEGRLLLPDG